MKISSRAVRKTKPVAWFLPTLLGVAVLVTGYFTYSYVTKSSWPFKDNEALHSEELKDTNGINYDPPSKEDLEQSQDAKKNNNNQPEETEGGATLDGKREVAVGIAFADVVDGKVEVRAFTPGIIEGGGTCTAIFTMNNRQITVSSQAFIDSSSSQCSPIYVNTSDFPEKGTWRLTVTYSSQNATGVSDIIEVSI